MLVLLVAAVVATYCPWRVVDGSEALIGTDFLHIHERRIAFAQEELAGPRAELPDWYPRELMGAPFRANLQSFPLIPTRLAAFATCEPLSVFGASTLASAALAALFTYLLCRRLALSRTASAAAGWTFACAGFFASRVLAGHLPLLEAYPALPALLYATERAATRAAAVRGRVFDGTLLAAALTSACFSLAGHPQLVVYALACSVVYACVRAPSWKRAATVVVALALGAGVAGFALVPMASLTSRSTRILDLERASNDLALPYGRLAAFVRPWGDGWPASVSRGARNDFHGYPSAEYFWDTVSYVGWAPLVALALLAALVLARKLRANRAGWFFALAGVVALVLTLPLARELAAFVPGTFLRSPARLLYVVSFSLALALAFGLDRARELAPRWPSWALASALTAVLAAHAFDLGSHARAFVATWPRELSRVDAELESELRRRVGDGRAGVDYELATPLNRRVDDFGVFDSLLLARPYRFVLETSSAPPRTNMQALNASQFNARTLAACGVKLVWTARARPDLTRVKEPRVDERWFEVASPQARAVFVPAERVSFLASAALHAKLRDASTPLDGELLFDEEWRDELALTNAQSASAPATVAYERVGPDEIALVVESASAGVVRVLETWDPGWSATVDGAATRAAPAHDAFLACAVAAGRHEVRFEYATPHAGLGWLVSAVSLLLVAVLARLVR